MLVTNESELTRAAMPAASRLRLWLCFGCLLLPWVNPYAGGPSTWAAPWLTSGMCAALAFMVGVPGAPRAGVGLLLAGLPAWAFLRSGITPETVAMATACLLVWMVSAAAAGDAQERAFARIAGGAWLVAAVVSTVAALLQYFGLAHHFAPWVDASAAGEAYANLRQRNQFATLSAIGMAVLLTVQPTGRRRWVAMWAMACVAVGNAATTSRTGTLELLLLGALTWRWAGLRSQRMQLWLVGLAAYGAGSVLLPLLASAVSGVPQTPLWMRVTGVDPCSSRVVLWSNVLHLIAQRPWLGWGWGELDYAHYMTLYAGPRFCDILDNAHDLPLHLAVELGTPAAVAVCAVVVWGIWRAKPWSERDALRQMAWGALLVIGVHSLLEYPLWYGPFQIALGVCLGVLWPATKAASGGLRGAWHPAASALLGAATFAGAAYGAWDYHAASQIYLSEEDRSPAWRHDPLARAGGIWLFRNQVRFAELTLTPLTRNNAAWTFERASDLLHYSPEPRVIEKLIESALLLHRDDVVLRQLARFRAAFPQAYQQWAQENRRSLPR